MREDLGIDDWLELVKEDKNLNGAYISFAQYMYLLEKENQELKKQLEKKYNKTGTLTNEVLYEENTKLINQQKEFIEYLENMICVFKKDKRIFSSSEIAQYNADLLIEKYEEILSKYKEIIGGK